MPHDPFALPPDLPVPEDDGAADHLEGMAVPALHLPSSKGEVALADMASTRLVLYVYPRTGPPEEEIPPEWDLFPGARGCTPQACDFRDRAHQLAHFGAAVVGVSAQSLAEQEEFAARVEIPFPVASDEGFRLAEALSLPTFHFEHRRYYKRLALIAERGRIVKVFYPVFPPDRSARDVLAWLRTHRPLKTTPGAPG